VLVASVSEFALDTASVSDDTSERQATERGDTTGGKDMTDPTRAEKQFLDAIRESQRAIVEAVGAWAKSAESVSAVYQPVPELPDPPTPAQVVDNAFDFAEKLLAAQREFARNLLAAAEPAFPPQDGTEAPAPTENGKEDSDG
jgi:hypothetical protein